MPTPPNNRGINTPPSPPTPPPKNPRLSILSYLEAGFNPAKIAAKMNLADSTIQYHLSILKKQGLIQKVGYGTWELIELPKSEKKTTAGSSHVGHPQHPHPRGSLAVLTQSELTRFTQDAVRAHAILTKWSVPTGMRNWNNHQRIKYLTTRDIQFKPLNIGGGGQRIIVKDRKTWLTDKSIIIYDKSSYFAEEALQAKNTALATHLSIIKHVERLLHTSFLIGSDYKFRVSRQHYALIYNALAKQYNRAGEKLEVRTGKGLWLLIDDSYGMDELETVHPSTGMADNLSVQGFFNSLKKNPLTTDFIFEVMGGIQQNQQTITANQMAYATNIESHITSIKDLGTGVRDMNKLLQEFAEGQKA